MSVLYSHGIAHFYLHSQWIHVIALAVNKEKVLKEGYIGNSSVVVIIALAGDAGNIHQPGASDQGKIQYGEERKN